MRKHLAVLSILASLLFAFSVKTSVYSQKRPGARPLYVEDRILVKMRPGARPETDRVLGPRSTRIEPLETPEPTVAGDEGGLYVVNLDGSLSVEEAVRQASANPNVEYAEPDYFLYPTAMVPDDLRFDEQWPLLNKGGSGIGKAGADIGATRAWDFTTGSGDVVVGVIDQGIDFSHPDLDDNRWINPGEVAGNGIDDDLNGFVDDIDGWNFLAGNNQTFVSASEDFHGTHVAGIIGAEGNNGLGVSGVAWRVKLMALKFLDARSGTTSDAVKAIKYAIALRKKGVNIRVLNASFSGTEEPSSLRKAIESAGKEGILFVTVSGNGGADSRGDDADQTPEYPGAWSTSIASVISVAALDIGDNFPSFSNYGHASVSVAAPGVAILSTHPGGVYIPRNGTSMAAPHVSGIAALLYSYPPTASFTPEQIRKRIIDTAEPVLSIASKAVSSGRANAFCALTGTIALAQSPVIGAVQTTKKEVILDGLGFLSGSSVIEVNGVALTKSHNYDSDYALANGTLSRLRVKLGKANLKQTFPAGVPVSVTVFNPTTNERSPSFSHTRF